MSVEQPVRGAADHRGGAETPPEAGDAGRRLRRGRAGDRRPREGEQEIAVRALQLGERRIQAGETPDLRSLLREPLYLPEGLSALRALERLRHSGSHLALVIDEYGGIEGLVTWNDILQAIIGDLPAAEQEEPMAVQRDDGSWLLDGMLPVSDLREILELSSAESDELEEFRTLGGFVMGTIGRIPATGDHFEWNGWRFEVIDMDHRRVDKVLVARALESVTE